MTEEQLAEAGRLMSEAYDRMAVARERFVEHVIRHTDMMKQAIERIRMFEDHLDLRLKAFDARLDLNHNVLDALQALIPALSEAGVSWHENNEKLDRLMKKLDTHLGGEVGLEYDN